MACGQHGRLLQPDKPPLRQVPVGRQLLAVFGLLVLPCTDVVVDGRSITEFCTPKSCPVMSAGPKYEYLWADGNKIKKPIKVSAPEYVDYLMTWVQEILDDESVFPSRVDVPFPRNFMQGPPPVSVPLIEYRGSLLLHIVQWSRTSSSACSACTPTSTTPTFRRLVPCHRMNLLARSAQVFRCSTVTLGEEAHLNTCFKHFYYFIDEFDLVDKREMLPLQELIDNLTKPK